MALTRPEISKRYQERNPDKVRDTKRKNYLKNKVLINQRRRERHEADKEKENEQCRKWYSKNKEKKKEYTRKYRSQNKSLFQSLKDAERFGGNKQAIFSRDEFVCQLCRAKESWNNKPLIIHHIDGSGNSKGVNNDMENLITLCNWCHLVLHGYQKKEKIIFQTRQDIVRSMVKVIEDRRKTTPVPRNRKSNI